MCFNNSTFASRASFNTLVSDQLPGRISIENNLANNLEALEFDILNESPKYTLKVGDPLILSSSNVVRQAEVTWSREQWRNWDFFSRGVSRKVIVNKLRKNFKIILYFFIG
jgi:hypothetical protein